MEARGGSLADSGLGGAAYFDALTPRKIVAELDQYIIGQGEAKRAMAIALRNRWRRQQLDAELREEVLPKNIILIGPTGVGKTEIARRMARLTGAPFLKVEASKFTEVGYVGRDVESMVRDLLEMGIHMVRKAKTEQVAQQARTNAESRLLDLLVPGSQENEEQHSTRQLFLEQLRRGELDQRHVEVEVPRKRPNPQAVFEMMPVSPVDMDQSFRDILSSVMPRSRGKTRELPVPEALELLIQEESEKLIDMDDVATQAIHLVEQQGIVFLDEIDKIAGSSQQQRAAEISREGVQRDILPLVEGTTVNTRHGQVNTDHVLFIAAGAFHVAKPSDLIPELQGRFPIRVELKPLTENDLVRILTEPKNALIKQYVALLQTEEVTLAFDEDAIRELAKIAVRMNERSENIGARRLHALLEKTLEELSFAGTELRGQQIPITPQYVHSQLDAILADDDLSRYIL